MCIYAYVCIHVCNTLSVCMYIYMYIHICIPISLYIYMYMYVYMYIYICLNIYIYRGMCIYTHHILYVVFCGLYDIRYIGPLDQGLRRVDLTSQLLHYMCLGFFSMTCGQY